jgi:hypothetical protein
VTGDARGEPSFELIGREAERQRVDAVLDRLHETGGALLVRGEAGIGKSSLLRHARERAAALDLRALRTVGVESEAELAFAGLHQLLDSIAELVELLPDPRRRALRAALGIAANSSPIRFLSHSPRIRSSACRPALDPWFCSWTTRSGSIAPRWGY